MKILQNKSFIRKAVALVCAVAFCIFTVSAQSSGDKLYNQGLALQKTMTVAAQNQAIAKFQSAKKLYDSAAKKSQCDQAISVSRNIISSLGKGGSGGGGTKPSSGGGSTKNNNESSKPKATLSLSNSNFNFDKNSATVDVTVTTNQSDWKVTDVDNSDGSSFVSVKKTGDHTFSITVPYNSGTTSRSQYVQVTAGDAKERISVVQLGREIVLKANKTMIQAKKKGGNNKLTIECNYAERYAENNEQNWHVVSAPDWVTISAAEKKEAGWKKLGKGLLEATGVDQLISSGDEPVGDLVKSEMQINVDPNETGASRKGEVVIESGFKQFKISVTQTN